MDICSLICDEREVISVKTEMNKKSLSETEHELSTCSLEIQTKKPNSSALDFLAELAMNSPISHGPMSIQSPARAPMVAGTHTNCMQPNGKRSVLKRFERSIDTFENLSRSVNSAPAINMYTLPDRRIKPLTFLGINSEQYCNSKSNPYGPGGGGRGERLNTDVMRVLLRWLLEHRENPYPSDSEKQKFRDELGMTSAQVNHWFINARRRILKKLDLPPGEYAITDELVDCAERMTRRGRKRQYFYPADGDTGSDEYGVNQEELLVAAKRRAVEQYDEQKK